MDLFCLKRLCVVLAILDEHFLEVGTSRSLHGLCNVLFLRLLRTSSFSATHDLHLKTVGEGAITEQRETAENTQVRKSAIMRIHSNRMHNRLTEYALQKLIWPWRVTRSIFGFFKNIFLRASVRVDRKGPWRIVDRTVGAAIFRLANQFCPNNKKLFL
jgi:hypothetical protein